MYTYSEEHKEFLRKKKKRKWMISISQIAIILIFLGTWELLAQTEMINTFLSSSPSNVLKTFISLFNQNNLWNHIYVTLYETMISFFIASTLGILIASILWWNSFIAEILDPYLTVLNSLPKVALGPLIIIWVGANTNYIKCIICWYIIYWSFYKIYYVNTISIINIYNGFVNTEKNYITLMKSFHASKFQIYKRVVLRSNIPTIINCLKVNISMSLIGVIMGELLVSKEGLGYLIMYGSQVFNINLVITAVVILAIISYLMYFAISILEKKTKK